MFLGIASWNLTLDIGEIVVNRGFQLLGFLSGLTLIDHELGIVNSFGGASPDFPRGVESKETKTMATSGTVSLSEGWRFVHSKANLKAFRTWVKSMQRRSQDISSVESKS